MGGPSPDSVSTPPSPYVALTLADIISVGWTVRGYCGRCALGLVVNLDTLCRAQGPGLLLWGRNFPCPIIKEGRFRCDGRMHYIGQTIGGGTWRRLGEVSDRDIAAIKAARSPAARRYIKPRDAPADA